MGFHDDPFAADPSQRVPAASPSGDQKPTARTSSATPTTWDSIRQSPQLAEWGGNALDALDAEFGGDGDLLARSLGEHAAARGVPRWIRRGQPEATWLVQFLTSGNVDASVRREWLRSGLLADDPQWLTQLLERERAQVARIFLLCGNIADYAYDPVRGYRPAVRVLMEAMRLQKDCVLKISLSQRAELLTDREDVEQHIDSDVRRWMEQEGFRPDAPLVPQLCTLFHQLRNWLERGAARELTRGVTIILENIHLMIPSERADLERNFLIDSLLTWSASPTLFHSPHCLVLTAETLEDVSAELRARGGKIDQIDIPRPMDSNARMKFLMPLLEPAAPMPETRFAQLRTALTLDGYDGDYIEKLRSLSHDMAGLTYIAMEDILQQVAFEPGRALNRDEVMDAKRDRLQQDSGGLLEVVPPQRTLSDVAGYPSLKKRLRDIITAMQNAHDPSVLPSIPMGVLLLGPPGTGKTVAAEAIAGESNISLAKLGDFRGMYVGESERNLARVLSVLESLHPVIVFIDELDQSEGSRGESGDSGVGKRVFSKLMQFMSDTSHRGRILWVAASNRPDLIDAAMKRAGRFDLVLPFLLPDTASRAEVFKLLLQTKTQNVPRMDVSLREEDYQTLAEATEGFSGAEIEALIAEVLWRAMPTLADPAAHVTLGLDDIMAVREVYTPPQNRHHYRRMEDLALAEVKCLDILPPEYQNRCRELSERPEGVSPAARDIAGELGSHLQRMSQ